MIFDKMERIFNFNSNKYHKLVQNNVNKALKRITRIFPKTDIPKLPKTDIKKKLLYFINFNNVSENGYKNISEKGNI
jgi:hypothetical protein